MVESSLEDERSHGTLNIDASGSIHDWCFLTWNTTSQNKVIRSSPTEAHSFIHPRLLTHTRGRTPSVFLSYKHTRMQRLWRGALSLHGTWYVDVWQKAKRECVCVHARVQPGRSEMCVCLCTCVCLCVSAASSQGDTGDADWRGT